MIEKNRQSDIKCIHHTDFDIIYLCSTCCDDDIYQPACFRCVTTKHQSHTLIDIYNTELQNKILFKFENDISPKLYNQIKTYQPLLEESNQKFEEIRHQHKSNIEKIKKHFFQLHNRLSKIELDLINQLQTNFEENQDINNKITLALNIQLENIKNYEYLLSHNYDHNTEYIQMINHIYKSSQYKPIENDDLIYNNYEISVNENIIDDFTEISKTIMEIKIKPNVITKIKYNNIDFTIYRENDILQEGINNLTIEKGHPLPREFPKSVQTLLLPEGFDQSIDDLPQTISNLIVQNISHRLDKGSIPRSITKLTFDSGFNQKISKGVIQDSVTELSLGDIEQSLDTDSIPNSVKILKLFNGFKQAINGVLPGSVDLLIDHIKIPLQIGSIPNTITKLTLNNGFNHRLIKGIIPDSVLSLFIGDILKPIEECSIPFSVKEVTFKEGYRYSINKKIIPRTVQELFIGDILNPILTDSIPNTISKLTLGNGYRYHIPNGVIPDSVKSLTFGDILQQLDNDSIPRAVFSLLFKDGYRHKINREKIPSSVQELFIYDVILPLDTNSIPYSMPLIEFNHGYRHSIVEGVIPESFTRLFIGNIVKSLEKGSIPLPSNDTLECLTKSYKYLIFKDGYKHKISKEIIPYSVESLHIDDIEIPLDDNSIPNSVYILELNNGYKHKISKGIIPGSVSELYIGDIVHPIDINLIQKDKTKIIFQNGYKHQKN